MDETWSVREIARRYRVDPKTAHNWTTKDWFPRPLNPHHGRGYPAHYDPAQVRRAITNWRRRGGRSGPRPGRRTA